MKYDFCGYATKNNVRCADGRIIRHNAFKGNDGQTVPLVWQHQHNEPTNVLGHAILENREDGVYTYGVFNETEQGQNAKSLVKHGDITSLSIYANGLTQSGDNVTHGTIREVSLVLAGANPEAKIENIAFAHSDGMVDISEEEAVMHFFDPIELAHTADTYTPQEKPELIHADEEDSSEDDETIEDVINTMTDKQKNAMYYVVGQAIEDATEIDDSDDSEEGDEMKHNIFDNTDDTDTLAHDALMAEAVKAIEEGPRYGSLKESFIQHGIEDIEILFPEAKTVTPTPDMITRPMDWVAEVWNATKKSPFARIKSIAANLTEDEARAKGYIKGKQKIEEVIGLLKRITTPQTVYKKQALDRDDIIDITDFDVVSWLHVEMRMMLNEELARAILVGDGRSVGAEDRINPENIRPIYQDVDLYTIHYAIDTSSATTKDEVSDMLVDAAVRSRKNYMGSGNPVMYASNDVITDMVLAKDKMGRRLYANETELAAALRVSKIVEVPVLEGVKRTNDDKDEFELLALIVNLGDYTVGADKGGAVTFFDDFDIDYNKEKYLIETRCSGALTHPYSAIALEKPVEEEEPVTPVTPPTGGGQEQVG